MSAPEDSMIYKSISARGKCAACGLRVCLAPGLSTCGANTACNGSIKLEMSDVLRLFLEESRRPLKHVYLYSNLFYGLSSARLALI